ncbi:hypothetical protein [Crocosphaera sp. XPORK-15E]|uniref:hypothetical protein n=1 Tax=Crocosphaera sp. XPORK-15E TaxID=3110247 RepID=UPI002B1F332E|nr:hypothetical protein [Crocosphaera sp. XPORK-15E]MEA5533733.1 hypothetical protein [Crocosphaera sp. XPORK-15E]
MAKSFRMRHDAEDWFSKIKNQKPPLNTKFDLYYLCLMMGLASKSYNIPAASNSTDFVEYFVSDYQSQQNLIIGLLIQAELSDKGLSLDDKSQTKKILKDLIDPSSITNLTDYGIDRMNAYASGGFDYLQTKTPQPYYAEEFLISYVRLLQEEMDNYVK